MSKQLQRYSYLVFAGLVAMLIADYLYPPLDENPPLILGLCLFFVPILVQIVVTVRKRLPYSFDRLRLIYIYSGGASILLSAFLALNGFADRAPVRLVQTSIARKYITSGRYSASFHIVVPSWRLGEDREKLRVNGSTYRAMYVGEPVVVEVHRGLFAVPWYGRISPH